MVPLQTSIDHTGQTQNSHLEAAIHWRLVDPVKCALFLWVTTGSSKVEYVLGQVVTQCTVTGPLECVHHL